jgi:hypothetical protein
MGFINQQTSQRGTTSYIVLYLVPTCFGDETCTVKISQLGTPKTHSLSWLPTNITSWSYTQFQTCPCNVAPRLGVGFQAHLPSTYSCTWQKTQLSLSLSGLTAFVPPKIIYVVGELSILVSLFSPVHSQHPISPISLQGGAPVR